jgi:uncharacterized protein YifN (PemK superfamily)
MSISFHPKAGMVLICDFTGYIAPEIIKSRPVVVITPNHFYRAGLCIVVPLSTTPPDPIQPYHYALTGSPFPNDKTEHWAKCDLVATVSISRLDRVKVARGNYQTFHVSMEQVREIRRRSAISLGIDI